MENLGTKYFSRLCIVPCVAVVASVRECKVPSTVCCSAGDPSRTGPLPAVRRVAAYPPGRPRLALLTTRHDCANTSNRFKTRPVEL